LGNVFEDPEVDFNYDDLPKDIEIEIIYRERIRLFYNTVKSAEDDGYFDYDKVHFPKPLSLLYGFTGLRGDAKDLYKLIKTGKE